MASPDRQSAKPVRTPATALAISMTAGYATHGPLGQFGALRIAPANLPTYGASWPTRQIMHMAVQSSWKSVPVHSSVHSLTLPLVWIQGNRAITPKVLARAC